MGVLGWVVRLYINGRKNGCLDNDRQSRLSPKVYLGIRDNGLGRKTYCRLSVLPDKKFSRQELDNRTTSNVLLRKQTPDVNS